jgi:hypothetical protein
MVECISRRRCGVSVEEPCRQLTEQRLVQCMHEECCQLERSVQSAQVQHVARADCPNCRRAAAGQRRGVPPCGGGAGGRRAAPAPAAGRGCGPAARCAPHTLRVPRRDLLLHRQQHAGSEPESAVVPAPKASRLCSSAAGGRVSTLVTAALAEAAGEPLPGALEADGSLRTGDGTLMSQLVHDRSCCAC